MSDEKPCECIRLGYPEQDCPTHGEVASLRAEVATLNEELAREVDAKCAAVLALDEARASLAEVTQNRQEWRDFAVRHPEITPPAVGSELALLDRKCRDLTAECARLREEGARLREALEEMASQHRCGCGHPACNNCGRDRMCSEALRPSPASGPVATKEPIVAVMGAMGLIGATLAPAEDAAPRCGACGEFEPRSPSPVANTVTHEGGGK